MLKLGLDIGSRNTKIVIYSSDSKAILYSSYMSTDIAVLNSVNKLITDACLALNLNANDIGSTGVTGYGRKLYPHANSTLSEITCHAAGCLHYFPVVKTIIDIGGQDSKVITLGANGKVADFVMNDKCAAGTGRFLEMTALRLGCDLPQLASLAAQSTQKLKLNSTCVVFAESEIIGMMASSTSAADIARAVHLSISKRISFQMSSLAWDAPLVFTGGVAQNPDLALCLGEELSCSILIPPDPEITGALGAAILAKEL